MQSDMCRILEKGKFMQFKRRTLFMAAFVAVSSSAANAETHLPPEIAAEGKVLLQVQAFGAQIYECKAGADGALVWLFREPVATLIANGETVGRHYAGPAWELTDGSVVKAKVAGKAAGATAADIPWLKLDVTLNATEGRLSGASTVQRVNTRGGAASGACERAGLFQSVPYSADYVFIGK
jgi:hypothetical protein